MKHPIASSSAGSTSHLVRCAGWLLLALGGIALTGCGKNEWINPLYGSRRTGGASVNGVEALANLFDRAGHKVRSWNYLSPTLDKADVIVWFPDDPNAPTADVDYWFYEWLQATPYDAPPRVLIYVGRDFDAEVLYWEAVENRSPPGMRVEYSRRLSSARQDRNLGSSVQLQRDTSDEWFTLEPAASFTPVTDLSGPWAEGIDASKVQIEHRTRLVPHDQSEVLLADDQGHPLVSETKNHGYYDELLSRVILVENGSFLLNATLVNHEHRKLAGKLVEHVGGERLDVVFLESDADGPPIRDTDPNPYPPTGLAMFRVWPIGVVLCQLAVLGILFALMRWPIFGVPRSLPATSLTDFGHHIAALGRLLQQTRGRGQAIAAVRTYRQLLERRPAPSLTVDTPSPITDTPSQLTDTPSPASQTPPYNPPANPSTPDPGPS